MKVNLSAFSVCIQLPRHKHLASLSGFHFADSNINYFNRLLYINSCVLVSIKLDFCTYPNHYILEFLTLSELAMLFLAIVVFILFFNLGISGRKKG